MEEKWLAQLTQVIVKEQFGEVAEEAVENLLKFGPQKYDDLKRMLARTKPTDSLMRDVLSVLIQHGILRFRTLGAVKISGGSQKELHPVVYIVDPISVLNRLKYPKYISQATAKYGDIAGLIMCVILENGIISYEKILSIISSKLIQDYNEDGVSGKDNEFTIAEKVKRSFSALLKNHMVVKASPKNNSRSEFDPDYNPDEDDEDGSNRNGGSASNIFASKRKRKNSDVKRASSNVDDVMSENSKKRRKNASKSATSIENSSELMFMNMLLDQKKVDGADPKADTAATTTTASGSPSKAEGSDDKKQPKKTLKESITQHQKPDQGFFEDTIDVFVPKVAPNTTDANNNEINNNNNDNGVSGEDGGDDDDDEMKSLWQVNFKYLRESEAKANILKFFAENFGKISSNIVKVMLSMTSSSRAIEVDDLLAEIHRTASAALARKKERAKAMAEREKRIAMMKRYDAASDVIDEDDEEEDDDDEESEEELLVLEKMEQSRLNVFLEVMAKSKLKVMTKLNNPHDPTLGIYVVETSEVNQNIKNRIIESIIKGKFGQLGLRIYRILRDKEMIEHFQITEIAKIPSPETTLDVLYKFLSWGYVSIQELSKGFRDPATSVFLWHVDPAEIGQRMANEVLHTMLNFKIRMAAEREKVCDLLTKAEAEKMLPPSAPSVLTDEEKSSLDKFYMKQDRLEITIIEMIDTYMKLR